MIGKLNGRNMDSQTHDQIEKDFRDGRDRRVIEAVEAIAQRQKLDAWLLKRLGIARIRLKEFAQGIRAIMEALDVSDAPDAELWSALAEAFEQTGKPACAGECYKTAAAMDSRHSRRYLRRAETCLRTETCPEDIAVSRVFFRASQRDSPLSLKVQRAKRKIEAKLYRPRWASDESTFLHVLRGHSSFTPIIKGSGGGYLLMHHGKGCVIDPGHNFVRNFLEQGYGFGDIYAVLVTHAHDDHVMDLPAIASILSKAGLRRKVDLYLDETSYMALRGHYLLAISGLRLRHPILRAGQSERTLFDERGYSLHLDVYETRHDVPILTDAKPPSLGKLKTQCGVGLGFQIGFPGRRSHYLLMPSDTGWAATLNSQYRTLDDGDVAVVHISSLKNEVEWVYPDSNEEEYLDPKHMGLLGVIGFIREARPRYVILSEKGAELDGVWHELADSIRAAFADDDIVVCPSEIGTKVIFDGEEVGITRS